jgi:dipeptidyl aminopeptidase/acylaminoacyl peptidase
VKEKADMKTLYIMPIRALRKITLWIVIVMLMTTPVLAQYDLDGAVIVFDAGYSGLLPDGTFGPVGSFIGTYTPPAARFEELPFPDPNSRYCPRWSADGTRIAYLYFSPDNDEIRVTDSQSINEIIIAQEPYFYTDVDWSLDNTRLIYVRYPRVYNSIPERTLWIANTINGTRSPLSQVSPGFVASPVFAADGNRIAYVNVRDIFITTLSGAAPVSIPLPPEPQIGRLIRWSPVADQIAFHGVTEFEESIYVVNIDGTELRRLNRVDSINDFADFQWAPDGSGVFVMKGAVLYWLSANVTDAEPLYVADLRGTTGFGMSGGCFDIYVPPRGAITTTPTLSRSAAGQTIRATLMHAGTVTIADPRTIGADGRITLPRIPYGAYTLWVKHAQHLGVSRAVTVDAASVDAPFPPLRTGDVNDDNRVTLADFSILSAAFGAAAGAPAFDPRADLNGDGAVSISDYTLLAGNYGQVGVPDPSAPEGTAARVIADPAPVELRVTPASVRVGQVVTLTVRAGREEGSIDGAGVRLRFDPARFAVESVTAGRNFDRTLLLTWDNAAGTVDAALGRLGGRVGGRFTLLTVRLRALSAGESAVTVEDGLVTTAGSVTPLSGSVTLTVR